MSTPAVDTLHDVHTATNDVIKGYREMSARAQPDIQAVISRLTQMHERHAAEQTAELSRLRENDEDDSSLQGTVNKVVVILRDWVSNLDRDVLPAVRDGEESLRKEYVEALDDDTLPSTSSMARLLKQQLKEIDAEIARLPRQ